MISLTKTSGRAPRPFPPIRAGLLLALGALLVAGRSARALSLNPDAGVAPKVFTPNADAINDVVCFQMDNPALTELRGTVSDAAGAEVAQGAVGQLHGQRAVLQALQQLQHGARCGRDARGQGAEVGGGAVHGGASVAGEIQRDTGAAGGAGLR